MDILKFKKGLEENLPKELEKDTFYISTDTKKMRLNDAVWEDTENVKSELNKKIEENKCKNVFVGTQNEYEIAYAKGEIAVGALVIILDENEMENETTIALLGTAILGKMILGNK